MNIIEKYVAGLRETDLVYLNRSTVVKSLLDVSEENKIKKLHQKQIAFIQNLKILRENLTRKDNKGKEINSKLTKVARKLLRDIYKLKKAALIGNQDVKDYYEFTELEESQSEDLYQFLTDIESNYRRHISVKPDVSVSSLLKKDERTTIELLSFHVEDTFTVERFNDTFKYFLGDKKMKLQQLD
jgi:hypothetical protein